MNVLTNKLSLLSLLLSLHLQLVLFYFFPHFLSSDVTPSPPFVFPNTLVSPQVLKPLGDHYMEDNIRLSVVNSLC